MAPVPLADLQPAFLRARRSQPVVAVPPDPDRQTVERRRSTARCTRPASRPTRTASRYIDPAEEQASGGADQLLLVLAASRACASSRSTRSPRPASPGPSADGNIDDPQFQWLARSSRPPTRARRAGDPLRPPPDPLADGRPARRARAAVHDRRPPRARRQPGLRQRSARLRSRSTSAPTSRRCCSRTRTSIAYVAGHTHEHKVTPFARPERRRLLGHRDLVGDRLADPVAPDRGDGQPRRHAVDLRHADRPRRRARDARRPARRPRLSARSTLASIGRELSFNDPQAGGGTGIGHARGPQRRAAAARPALSVAPAGGGAGRSPGDGARRSPLSRSSVRARALRSSVRHAAVQARRSVHARPPISRRRSTSIAQARRRRASASRRCSAPPAPARR